MDRRKFFQTSVALGATGLPVLQLSADSLYGTPGSKSRDAAENIINRDKIRLSLANAGVPAEGWDYLTRFLSVGRSLLTSPDDRAAFLQSPNAFLERSGLELDPKTLTHPDAAILAAICDDSIRNAAKSGSYRELVMRLQDGGFIREFDARATIGRDVAQILLANREKHKDLYAAIRAQLDGAATDVPFIRNELGFVIDEVVAATELAKCSIAGAVCLAVVALAVATAVHAAVIVNVELLVAVQVSVLVDLAVWGSEKQLDGKPEAILPGTLTGAINSGYLKDVVLAGEIAALQGNNEIRREIREKVIGDEVAAILDAMEQTGAFTLPPAARQRVEIALGSLIYRGAAEMT